MVRMLSSELLVLTEPSVDFQPDIIESTIVDTELRDLDSEPEVLVFFSHCVIASSVSLRRDWWRTTSQQGRKMVKISMNQMERQIL